MTAACLVRIGLDEVSAVWLSRAKKARASLCALSAAPEEEGFASNVALALDEVLMEVAPRGGQKLFGFDLGRLPAPHVRVAVADPLLRAALMKFVKLPRSAADRALLVSERFCREHKLEKSAFEVAASLVHSSENQQTLLCCAMPRLLLKNVKETLAAHGLYADFIAPEALFGLQGASAETPGPGALMLVQPGYVTLALRDGLGTLAHMACLRQGGQSPQEFLVRLKRRVARYATLLRTGDKPFVVEALADPGLPEEIARGLAEGLAHLPFRFSDGRRPDTQPKRLLARLRRADAPEPFWRAMLMEAP